MRACINIRVCVRALAVARLIKCELCFELKLVLILVSFSVLKLIVLLLINFFIFFIN